MSEVRIAYFAEIFPSQSETWVHHEIIELQRRGCAVRVFATHPRPTNVPNELRALVEITTYLSDIQRPIVSAIARILKARLLAPIARGFLFDAKTIRQRVQILRDLLYTGFLVPYVNEFRPSVMFAHFAGTRTNLAMFCSFLNEVPFAFKMHAGDVFVRPALLRLKVAEALHVMTISNYNIEFMRTSYPDIDSSRLQKHGCGVPIDMYQYQPPVRMCDVPTVVAVGRLIPMKGFDVLIRASRVMIDCGFEHEILIVGDGPARAALESLKNELGLQDVVTFTGYLAPDRVRAAVCSATAFVLPAVWDPVAKTQDGIPVALMEAMALGIPVVSTTTSGIPELIQDGINGFLVPPCDPSSLAKVIIFCCGLDLRSKLALLEAARRVVEEDYNAATLADALLMLLSSSDRSSPASPTVQQA